MTPAPHDGPAHRRRLRRDSSTPQTAHGRHRTTVHPPSRARAFAPRPTTLWPFADVEPLPGTARLAGWLGRTIVTLVTTYTRPGDRVLLLAPPISTRLPARMPDSARAADPYAGLTEAVWTVTRLGRSVDTATGATPPDYRGDPPAALGQDDHRSGSGPRPTRLGLRSPAATHPGSEHRLARVEHRPGTDFDLIITAVHPDATDWFSDTDWDSVLTSAGMLAVITYGDRRHGRLVDPMAVIAATFRSQWRGVLDHIAVLTEHVPGTSNKAVVASAPPAPAPAAARNASEVAVDPMPMRSVHHDLLLIGAVPAATPMPVPRTGAGRRQENLG